MWFVRPARPAFAQSDRSLCWSLEYFMCIKCQYTYWTSFWVSKLTRRQHRLVWVYTCQNATVLDMSRLIWRCNPLRYVGILWYALDMFHYITNFLCTCHEMSECSIIIALNWKDANLAFKLRMLLACIRFDHTPFTWMIICSFLFALTLPVSGLSFKSIKICSVLQVVGHFAFRFALSLLLKGASIKTDIDKALIWILKNVISS